MYRGSVGKQNISLLIQMFMGGSQLTVSVQIKLTNFVKGIITVQLTSCLASLKCVAMLTLDLSTDLLVWLNQKQ